LIGIVCLQFRPGTPLGVRSRWRPDRVGSGRPRAGNDNDMVSVGYFLSCEEHTPAELVEGAVLAEQAGFSSAWISDHFHPWNDEQGQSPFVWSVLGAIAEATRTLRVYTAVTCPTVRIHPAIIAQAAATTQLLFGGRFGLGVGTGEALNEHIFGDAWPSVATRLDMLDEAVEVMRKLWTGDVVSHAGRHYTVDNARIYSAPAEPVRVWVSAFGPKAVARAARIADGGYMSVMPSRELLEQYRSHGGSGTAHGGVKVCYAPTVEEGRRTAHRLWPNQGLPGELSQVLPTPQHFMQASQLVPPDLIAESVPCGADPGRHIEAIQKYADAGFDEVYVGQIGPDQKGMIEFYANEVLPHFATAGRTPGR
jgi:G6PDH family F420-dependent oxidoreductase